MLLNKMCSREILINRALWPDFFETTTLPIAKRCVRWQPLTASVIEHCIQGGCWCQTRKSSCCDLFWHTPTKSASHSFGDWYKQRGVVSACVRRENPTSKISTLSKRKRIHPRHSSMARSPTAGSFHVAFEEFDFSQNASISPASFSI